MDKDGGGRNDDGHDGGDGGGQHGSGLAMTMAATTTVAAVAATEELSLRRRGTGRTQQLSGAGGSTRGRLAGQRPRWQAGQARISPADSRGAVALMMLIARGRRCALRRSSLTLKMISISPCL